MVVDDVLILGGGLAGAGAAALLAQQGRQVQLLERENGPHDKVCGEFLSVEAREDLAVIGLDLGLLGAVDIDRVRLANGPHAVEARLPFVASGISRRILDEALLENAARHGARIERGVRVTAVGNDGAATSAGSCRASRILLATGKHDVRGATRATGKDRSPYVGFKMHWRLPSRDLERLRGVIELTVFEGGYAGLQLVSADTANLCLIVTKERFSACGSNWDGLLRELTGEPALARLIEWAQPMFPQPLTIANLPYGYLCDAAETLPTGIIRIGDQASMTASLTGDGMAAALRSARIVAKGLAGGATARECHRMLRQALSGQVRRAMTLQRATEARLAMRMGFGILKMFPGLLGTLAGATRLAPWRQ